MEKGANFLLRLGSSDMVLAVLGSVITNFVVCTVYCVLIGKLVSSWSGLALVNAIVKDDPMELLGGYVTALTLVALFLVITIVIVRFFHAMLGTSGTLVKLSPVASLTVVDSIFFCTART